jgi:hypothetical protein
MLTIDFKVREVFVDGDMASRAPTEQDHSA